MKRLERALERGPFAHGYTGDFWTLERIRQLIGQLFEVRYGPSGAWHVMERLSWSCQGVQRRSIARDDEAVPQWRRCIWAQADAQG